MSNERTIRVEGLYPMPVQMPFKSNYILALVKDLQSRLDNDPELFDVMEISNDKE